MAIGKTLVLCSPFSGTLVTDAGKPVVGVKMKRTWNWGWNDKTGSDETITDAAGRFTFPLVTGKSLMASFAPHEPGIDQEIIADDGTRQVKIWRAQKNNYQMNGELKGRAINVICHFDKEPSSDFLYWGTCEEKN